MSLKKNLLSASCLSVLLLGTGSAAAQVPTAAIPSAGFGGGLGVGLPYGIDPVTVGNTFLEIGIGAIEEGGLNGIPLIGEELSGLTTPEGAQAGLTMLATEQKIPVGIPVVGRQPQKLYGPVFITVLRSNGVPVDMLPFDPVSFDPASVLAP